MLPASDVSKAGLGEHLVGTHEASAHALAPATRWALGSGGGRTT